MLQTTSRQGINNTMAVARVFAIIAVIFAHSRSTNYYCISTITERIGAIGVPVFFFISGYFFEIKHGIKDFWMKKTINILVPWFFTGLVMYTITEIYTLNNWDVFELGKFILYNSYLWYLSVLLVCYMIFSFIQNKWYLASFIVFNIASLLLTAFDIINPPNSFMNIFNWAGFFAAGFLLKGHLEKALLLLKTKVILILPIYIIILVLSVLIEPDNGTYFSKLALPMELAGMVVIFTLASLSIFNIKLIYIVSGLTFSIYLTHFMIFPVTRLLIQHPVFEFINPLIILVLNVALLLLGEKIASLLKLQKVYAALLGIRI